MPAEKSPLQFLAAGTRIIAAIALLAGSAGAATQTTPARTTCAPAPQHHAAWTPRSRELRLILARHVVWLEEKGAVSAAQARALLAPFGAAGTEAARCPGEKANLQNAVLIRASLSGVDLSGVKDQELAGADLSGANLTKADMTNADLTFANLADAFLNGANLTGAIIDRSNLSKTRLNDAILTNATYAAAGGDPPFPYVVDIQGLKTLRTAPNDESGLVQLQKLFQAAGLRDEERQVTVSVERGITRDSSWPVKILRIVGLYCTTCYGLYPFLALIEILGLALILTPVYMRAILRPSSENGIVQVFPADRIDGTAGDPAEEKEIRKKVVEATGWAAALKSAAYFSLLSAVNIGFEQFTPGDWIRRLQAREYSLEAVGWVRVVAGSQALISVFLLAMWALTQFGRPFE